MNKQVKTPSNGICALCRNNSKLCESHIVPTLMLKEGIFRPKRGNRETFKFKSWEDDFETSQDGFKIHLLCEECEGKFSKYEAYMGRLFPFKFWNDVKCNASVISRDPLGRLQETRNFEGVNYHKFKMFVLSVLWRMSVYGHVIKAESGLNTHEEKLRKILLADECPPEHVYPISLSRILLEGHEKNIIWLNKTRHLNNGIRTKIILMGGYVFDIILEEEKLPGHEESNCLHEDGTISVPTLELQSTPLYKALTESVPKGD